MTERLADLNARIDGVRQLGAVVNAMRGIAAARAQQARNHLDAVDGYADAIAQGIGRTLALMPTDAEPARLQMARPALVLFCAEQGFAGPFSERVLDAVGTALAKHEVFLVGTRGMAVAVERHIRVRWHSAMPSHSAGIPRLADRIAEALYARLANGEIDSLDVLFSRWRPGHGLQCEQQRLFPLDARGFEHPVQAAAPLLNLAPGDLLFELTSNYVHATLCQAALHAYAAENESRMGAMAAARRQIERQLAALLRAQRIVRQEEITAEIIELAAGESASRKAVPLGLRRRGGAPP